MLFHHINCLQNNKRLTVINNYLIHSVAVKVVEHRKAVFLSAFHNTYGYAFGSKIITESSTVLFFGKNKCSGSASAEVEIQIFRYRRKCDPQRFSTFEFKYNRSHGFRAS